MKKNIAVIFGSKSPEHDISIITAISAIIKPLKLAGQYNVIPVYIAKNGAWYSDKILGDVATYRNKTIDEFCAKSKPVSLIFDGGLVLQKPGLKREKVRIDIAFPATHGAYGEDGSLMGLLRMAGVPFVGCDMPASVIAMDKVLAKQLAEANNIPTPKYEFLYRNTFENKVGTVLNDLEKSLRYPLFIKPAHLGSSIGITRVANRTELQNAIEVAAYYDDKILVEEAVLNLIEVTVPIMGNHGSEAQPAMVERPLNQEGEFFDFDTKYLNGGKKTGSGKKGAQGYSEIPANISKKLYNKSVEVALSMYRATECEGLARIDLLIDSKNEVVYFNEVNPMPGSLYAHNWRQTGVSGVELVTRLIDLAVERHTRQQKLESSFQTNFLKQF
jgi:D-alanine-D-alanine ligase